MVCFLDTFYSKTKEDKLRNTEGAKALSGGGGDSAPSLPCQPLPDSRQALLHRRLSVGVLRRGLGVSSLAVCSPDDLQELTSVKLEKTHVGNPQTKNVLLSVSDWLLNKTTVRSKQKPLHPPDCWDPTLSS